MCTPLYNFVWTDGMNKKQILKINTSLMIIIPPRKCIVIFAVKNILKRNILKKNIVADLLFIVQIID